MMLTGKTIKPKKAKSWGLIDMTVEPLGPGIGDTEMNSLRYLEEVAVQAAKDLASGKLKKTPRKKNMQDKILDKMLATTPGKNYVFGQAKAQVMKMSKGLYPAPLKILEVARAGIDKREGYKAEREGFGHLAMTSQSKGLIGLFKGQTECKKNSFGKPQKRAKYAFFLFNVHFYRWFNITQASKFS